MRNISNNANRKDEKIKLNGGDCVSLWRACCISWYFSVVWIWWVYPFFRQCGTLIDQTVITLSFIICLFILCPNVWVKANRRCSDVDLYAPITHPPFYTFIPMGKSILNYARRSRTHSSYEVQPHYAILVLYFSSLSPKADAKSLEREFLSARTAFTNSRSGPKVRKLSKNVRATWGS